MKRFLKWFAVVAFVAIVATAVSYGGMRVRLGQLIGEAGHAFVERQISFGKDSVPGHGERLAWRITWGAVRVPSTPRAVVWVSPTGTIIATEPANLEARITAYERAREP